MKYILHLIIILGLFTTTSCGIYTFSGTSIASDVKSISIDNIQNRSIRVNPALSNTLTEALVDRFRKFTKLDVGGNNGDLLLEGSIVSYELTSLGITTNETASKNRLSITVKIKFTNKKYPKENFEKSFAAYEEFSSLTSFDSVESSLVEEIVKKLVDQIFNDSVAQW